MHGLILAGGEGSRLAADGVTFPKPLVPIAGRSQVVRLVETLHREGCASVTVMVRQEFAEPVRKALKSARGGNVRVESCRTPSSLHTLAEGLAVMDPGPILCTMVDTVMPAGDWHRVAAGIRAGLASGYEMMLAVTGHVDDESPLWVRRDARGDATWLGRDAVSPPCVTGGVYGFSARSRELAGGALELGLSRLREFLGWAADAGTRIGTVEVERIIDLDRRQDLEQAIALLEQEATREIPA